MAQVEDVAPTAGFAHRVIDAGADGFRGAEQQAGVHIALHAEVVGQASTAIGHVNGPIERDEVHTGAAHPLQYPGAARDVENHRGVGVGLLDQLHHLALIRSSKRVVVRGAQLTGPGIKHLHHLGAGIDLIAQVGGDRFSEVVEQLVQQLRLAEGHGLDHRIVLAALAFHHIGGQGPRSAHKTQHRGVVANAAAQPAEHLANKWHGFSGHQRPQGFHLGQVADRIVDLGALAFDDVEINPHAGQRREDVGEQNHAVGLEGVVGLHRDLVGEIWVLRAFAEGGVFIPQIPVDLHVPAGLTHHPDRRTLHLLPTGGAQQQGQGVTHGARTVKSAADATRGIRPIWLQLHPLLLLVAGSGRV